MFRAAMCHHQENYCISATPGLCHSVQMTVWYAGAYAPAYQNRNKHTWKIVRKVGYLQGSYQVVLSTKQKITTER